MQYFILKKKKVDYGVMRTISHGDVDYDFEEVVHCLQPAQHLALEHQGSGPWSTGIRVFGGQSVRRTVS